MLSIPEIAAQLVNKSINSLGDDNSRTIFFAGSKSVGKSTLIYSFLEKTDTPRETLVLEYVFGRKSRQSIEKTICHVWEYGGKLDTLKHVLLSLPMKGKSYYCIMVDLSKIKAIWNTVEVSIQAFNETYSDSEILPELVIVGGKYDLFKNYDTETRKFICTTLRSVALIHNAHLIFYSAKDAQLTRRVKDIFHNIAFGTSVHIKEKNQNFTKPLCIPKGADSWESIGIANASFDQVKLRHTSRLQSEDIINAAEDIPHPQLLHPEPHLDSIVASKYEELRNRESFDISINDYINCLQ